MIAPSHYVHVMMNRDAGLAIVPLTLEELMAHEDGINTECPCKHQRLNIDMSNGTELLGIVCLVVHSPL